MKSKDEVLKHVKYAFSIKIEMDMRALTKVCGKHILKNVTQMTFKFFA